MRTATTEQPPLYLGQQLYIKPTYIVSIPVYDTKGRKRTQAQIRNNANLTDNTTKGLLSKKAQTKLRNAINWLMHSSKPKRVYDSKRKKNFYFKVNFLTLTIPPVDNACVGNKAFKEVLHAWLMYARKYFHLKNYVWKVEAHQDGRLHIHITSDTFIHHKSLRESWNRLISKRGWLDNYYSTHGHYNANSTDVHSVISVKNMAAYMIKYMTKKSHLSEAFKGRIWGCNYELSEANGCSLYLDPYECAKEIKSLINPNINYKTILSKPDIWGNTKSVGEIFLLKLDDWTKRIKGAIKRIYDDHRFYIRYNIFKPPPEYFTI